MSKLLKHVKPGITQETRLEKIHNVIFDNSKIGSKAVAREIADLIKYKQSKKQKCILGLATGSSPITVYEELINIHKKEKLITFVGKLNSAKGYDLFGKSILKILDKHKDWKSIVIGDEPREKHIFRHKNLKIHNFKENSYVLNLLKKK